MGGRRDSAISWCSRAKFGTEHGGGQWRHSGRCLLASEWLDAIVVVFGGKVGIGVRMEGGWDGDCVCG